MNRNLSCLRDPVDSSKVEKFNDQNIFFEGGTSYPILNGIPRFVSIENYSSDFGKQWNIFAKTQLDSYTGLDITESRLARCFNGELVNIKNKKVLEAGSGAGRFSEILIKHSAVVHSFDYSSAVEANRLNNESNENFVLVQGDIRFIPFAKNHYDYVVCLGVLQHTPNPEESIRFLWEMVKPGGKLIIDHYKWNLGLVLPPPIGGAERLYRTLILMLPPKHRFSVVKNIVDFWFPIHWSLRRSKIAQKILRKLSPVHFYYGVYKLHNKEMYYDWALLDTHDGTTDVYKHYRNSSQIRKVLEALGGKNIRVEDGGNGIEAQCTKI